VKDCYSCHIAKQCKLSYSLNIT